MAEQKPWEKYRLPDDPDAPWMKYGRPKENELGRLSGSEFARGIPQGARDVVDASSQLLARGMEALGETGVAGETGRRTGRERRERVEGDIAAREETYQAAREFPGAPDYGRGAGAVAATLPLAAVPGAGATGVVGRLAAGGAAGGAAGALSQPVPPGVDPVTYWNEKLKQFGLGAGFGAGTAATLGAAGRVISPKSSPQVQALRREGVAPTPGQVLGGPARDIEQKLTSLPLVGDVIRMGERRAILDFNRASVNRILKPAGFELPKNVQPGHQALEWAQTQLGNAYDDVLTRMQVKVDKKFLNDFQAVRQTAQQKLAPDMEREFQNIIKDVSLPSTRTGTWSGEDAKVIVSRLGGQATRLVNSKNPLERRLGEVVMDLRDSVHSALVRSSPVEDGARLSRLDRAWKGFVRVQKAAAEKGAKEGVFTPAHLRSASRSQDPSLRKGAFARGQAEQQEFAEAGQNVLGSTVPDSGTAGRAFMGLLLGGGGLSQVSPTAASLVGLGAAPYASGLGQRAVAAALAGRQGPTLKAIAQAVKGTGRVAAPAAGAASGRPEESEALIRYLRQ